MSAPESGGRVGHAHDPAEFSTGARYAQRLAGLAAAGHDLHGEARFCTDLLARAGAPPAARVLDAGCGTGRVAIRLAERGFTCVGADFDDSMLDEARRAAPDLVWARADLSTLDLPAAGVPEPFDLAVMAGNVVPLAAAVPTPPASLRAAPTLPAILARLAAHLRPGGLVVAGFGLDAGNLPGGVVPVPLADYDAAATAAGLVLHERYATWDAEPYTGGGYTVSVHRRV